MVHDVAVIGATIAGLTTARRLAAEGFDVVVLDPNPEGASAAIGHGVAACAHSSTVATMAAAYGWDAVAEHVRRNLAGIEEIQRVSAAGGVGLTELPLHDHSLGVALDRELRPVAEHLVAAGAPVRLLRGDEGRLATAGLVSDALALDPVAYARALEAQAVTAGAKVVHEVTLTHLTRREGVSVVAYRRNLVWSRALETRQAHAVVDTLGVSPWGRTARVGPVQWVPVVRLRAAEPQTVVSLLAGPPVWLVRPSGDEVLAFGPKCSAASIDAATEQLVLWSQRELGGEVVHSSRMAIDPSDHGRPVVGASAIPGGFYARGNGRGELMNGTASGCYLAAVLLGTDVRARSVALPWSSRARAQARAVAGRLRRRP